MEKRSLFVREATGLVRGLSLADALFFNILTASLFAFTFYNIPPIAFPGGDMTLATILFAFASVPMLVSYAMLGSTMPRAGGDYVFQSRILPPALALTIVGTLTFWSLSWIAWGGWWFVYTGFAPLLIRLGLLYGNSSMLNLGVWSTTVTGAVIITTLLIITVTIFHFFGMRLFVKIQRIMMASVAVAAAAMIVLFATTSTNQFISSFNSVMQPLANDPDYYHTIIRTALNSGLNATPGFSWYNTVGIFSVLSGTQIFFYYHIYFGGEIKRASELRNQVIATVGGALIFGIVVYALGIWLFLRAIDPVFWNAFALNSYTGSLTYFLPGLPPNMVSIATMMTSNVVLILIITIGFILQSYFIFFNSSLPQSRIIFAMAFDRLLPGKLADVSERFHSPVILLTIIMILGEAWTFLIFYTTWAALFATYLMSDLAIMFSMLAAVLLPYRARAMYDSSPISKYKLFGIPLITICGGSGFLFMAVIVWFILTVPALGFANLQSEIALGVTLLAAFVLYYVVKAYRMRQGIDIGLIFKQIPPE